mmetsp:Transcript_72684/g.224809  ORF Transcript_72684/g.224809 Transcript_72684/m.224809 type:complete len:252 (-) Transcript_72684:702-1457(-)
MPQPQLREADMERRARRVLQHRLPGPAAADLQAARLLEEPAPGARRRVLQHGLQEHLHPVLEARLHEASLERATQTLLRPRLLRGGGGQVHDDWLRQAHLERHARWLLHTRAQGRGQDLLHQDEPKEVGHGRRARQAHYAHGPAEVPEDEQGRAGVDQGQTGVCQVHAHGGRVQQGPAAASRYLHQFELDPRGGGVARQHLQHWSLWSDGGLPRRGGAQDDGPCSGVVSRLALADRWASRHVREHPLRLWH